MITYSTLITVCRKGGQLLRAVQVFEEMQAAGVQPNRLTYNTLIGAWRQQGQWEQALEVYDQMRNVGIVPDSITINSLIRGLPGKAAGKGLELLASARSLGVRPIKATYAELLTLCYKEGRWADAWHLYNEMKEIKVRPNLFPLSSSRQGGPASYTSSPLPPSTPVCGTNTARQRPVAFENGVPNQGTWA